LQTENQRLKDQIGRLMRDSSNSSKPPSSDIVKPKSKNRPRGKRKRKIGGPPGHPREERTPLGPDQIDRTIRHGLSPARSRGLIPLNEWAVLQQVELAEKLYSVTEHRARKYVDSRTGRIVIAPLPRGVRAASLVGPRLSALAAYQKGDCHMSYTTIRRFWGEVLVQFCGAHLIREIRFLAEHTDKSLRRWGEKLLLWVRKLFDRWHRAESLTQAGFARSMDCIRRGFLQAIRRPPARGEAQTLGEWFAGREAEDCFQFLTTPGIEPTNNQREQAIRHIVIDRNITQGTRGPRGQRGFERVWTVLATCRCRDREDRDKDQMLLGSVAVGREGSG
jgi:hypothetical protein